MPVIEVVLTAHLILVLRILTAGIFCETTVSFSWALDDLYSIIHFVINLFNSLDLAMLLAMMGFGSFRLVMGMSCHSYDRILPYCLSHILADIHLLLGILISMSREHY